MQYYRPFIARHPTLLVGDLGGAIPAGSAERPDHLMNAGAGGLQEGWVSAWRPGPSDSDGATPVPNPLPGGHCGRPGRIDSCLIPRRWLAGLQAATVCKAPPWIKLSRHLPLVVDVVPTR
jgi:hypothetical protein